MPEKLAKQIQKPKPVKNKKTEKNKNTIHWWDRIGLGKEKTYFVDSLSMLLGSGMRIDIALDSLEQEVRSKSMKKIILGIKDNIESGTSISTALERSRILSDHIIALIRIGERSGRLQENLKLIAEQQEKDRLFKSRIRSAMLYPALVITVSFVAGIGISWFILPRIVGIFEMIDTEIPLLTRILIEIGKFFVNYGTVFVPTIVTLFFVMMYLLFVNRHSKFLGQWLLFKMPITKKMVKEIELSRFGYLLGILLNAGLPVVEALDSIKESTTFYNYRKLFSHIRDRVDEGNTFLASFQMYKKSEKMVPIPIQHMIEAGEKSGTLSSSLLKIGKIYESKVEITTKSLTTVLEPILLIVIGIGVLILALAVITPIYGLIGGMH